MTAPVERRVRIVPVDAESTYELRRKILRSHQPESDVSFPEDAIAGAFHLAALDEQSRIVAVGSFYPAETAWRPDASAPWRLRGMAVDSGVQGRGIGRQLLNAATSRLRQAGADVLWADVRDSAEGFYARMGWATVGEGFEHVGIPHHVGVLDLR